MPKKPQTPQTPQTPKSSKTPKSTKSTTKTGPKAGAKTSAKPPGSTAAKKPARQTQAPKAPEQKTPAPNTPAQVDETLPATQPPLPGRDLVSQREADDYILEATYLGELYAETLYDEAVAKLEAALNDPGAANPVHGGFQAFLPGLMTAYEEQSRDWLDNAPDPAAREELTQVLAKITDRLRIQAVAHEHAARLRWRVETAETLLAGKLAAAKASPEMARVIRDAGDAVLDQMIDLGTAKDAAEARRAEFHADIAKTAVEALIESNAARALQRLETGEFDTLFEDTGADLKAALKAYAEEAAETQESDTDWLVEAGHMEGELTKFRLELEAGVRHRQAIKDGEGSFQAIEIDRQKGLISDAEADRLAGELKEAKAAARDRSLRVQETSEKIRRAIIAGEAVPEKDRSQTWQDDVDAFYEDLYRKVVETRPDIEFQIALMLQVANAADAFPRMRAMQLLRAMNSEDPYRMVPAAIEIDGSAANEGALASLTSTIPAQNLIRARAIAIYARLIGPGFNSERAIEMADQRLIAGAKALQHRQSSGGEIDLRGRLPSPQSAKSSNLPAAVIQRLAASGRGGDDVAGHVSPGALVVPAQLQTPAILNVLRAAFSDKGLEMGPLTVGGADDAAHPSTGAPDYSDPQSDQEEDSGPEEDSRPDSETKSEGQS